MHISLVAFTVAAFFHPIAYQFYFFCLAGLAVALVNAYRAEVAASVVSGIRLMNVVPTLLCGGTETNS